MKEQTRKEIEAKWHQLIAQVDEPEEAKSVPKTALMGAKVIRHGKIGYGIAYLEAVEHISGRYVIMGDADDTYEFSELIYFVRELKRGADLVI